jgi:hypothetical protein
MTVECGYVVRDLAMTHDFDDEVKRATAALAADRCLNPYCRALTGGPTNDRTKSLNIGIAAPISALAPGGSRYDARLSDTERHDQGNAIWLCSSCAGQVDNDVARYPAELLRSWKKKTGHGE